jgi:hypothetical protein
MVPNIYHEIFNSRFKISQKGPITPILDNRPLVEINTGVFLDANISIISMWLNNRQSVANRPLFVVFTRLLFLYVHYFCTIN